MRVAFITTYPPGKGSLNEYAFHFVSAMRGKAEVSEVLLFTDELPAGESYQDEEAQDGMAALRIIPCWRFDGISNAARIVQAVRREGPDVVFFNIQFASFGGSKVPATLGLLTPLLLKLFGFPTVVLLHNIMETVDLQSAGYAGSRVMEWLIRAIGTVITWLVLQADLVALTIPKYVEILQKKYGAKNVVLDPHGSFESARREPSFDLPPGPKQVMAFGKFGTYKKVEELIEAVLLLDDRGYGPLEAVIAGTDSPNAQGYLAAVQERYAHVDNVRFTGYVAEEDVPRIFQEAAVAVFPYTSTTGSSGVLHQAGDYGKAVVLPRIGDFAEVIQEEGYDGEFFIPGDVESLADAIERIITDPARRRMLGLRNFRASSGLPMEDIVDWYFFQLVYLTDARNRAGEPLLAQLRA